MNRTVRSVLDQKGRNVYSVAPGATVFEALQLMADKNIGAVSVLEEGRMVGILSERDYARKVILEDRSSKHTTVDQIMTSPVRTVTEDQNLDDCMALMTEGRFRHLPVVDGDQVIGLVSIGDVVRAVIEWQAGLIDDLERYITG